MTIFSQNLDHFLSHFSQEPPPPLSPRSGGWAPSARIAERPRPLSGRFVVCLFWVFCTPIFCSCLHSLFFSFLFRRRNEEKQPVCNACGLYFRLRKVSSFVRSFDKRWLCFCSTKTTTKNLHQNNLRFRKKKKWPSNCPLPVCYLRTIVVIYLNMYLIYPNWALIAVLSFSHSVIFSLI